jgi:hypothetical protein
LAALRQISAKEAVSGLTALIVQLAASRDDEIRMWAAEALESAVQPDASEVGSLTTLLEQAEDVETCYWAATMLGRLGGDATPATKALEACLRESMYLPARERATWALCQIGPAAAIATAALNEAARNAPPRLRRLARHALEVIQADQAASVQQQPADPRAAEEAAA